MLQETCARIDELQGFWAGELRARYARRNRLHEIDELLNQFEMLNLADEARVPDELRRRMVLLVRAQAHPLAERPPEEIGIAEWMEALYDLQDGLMVRFEDDID